VNLFQRTSGFGRVSRALCQLGFYVAAEDYIYGTTFVQSGTLEEKQTQNDIQLAVGFGVPLQR
jgi:hypothetical protein